METMTKNYIADRETYLTLKEVQKAIAIEIKTARKAYREELSLWSKTIPLDFDHYPQLHLSQNGHHARELNTIYGKLRGKTYKQIEPKVKEGNEPSTYALETIIKNYKLKREDFLDSNGEVL